MKKTFTLNKLLGSNRGISLVETTISMAVVIIVSMAAIAVISLSTSATSRSASFNTARIHADNALECFSFASDCEEFLNSLSTDPPEVSENNPDEYIYSQNYCTLKITADYTAPSPVFNAVCTDNKGETVFSFSYTKAPGGTP